LEIRKKNLKGRVAYLLIYFYSEIYKSLEYELPISRKEIADYIGMSTENVIRTLSEFRKDKIISINGKVIEIKDLDSLSSISQFG
jgi:CRP/FNR family transcriptional regulator